MVTFMIALLTVNTVCLAADVYLAVKRNRKYTEALASIKRQEAYVRNMTNRARKPARN